MTYLNLQIPKLNSFTGAGFAILLRRRPSVVLQFPRVSSPVVPSISTVIGSSLSQPQLSRLLESVMLLYPQGHLADKTGAREIVGAMVMIASRELVRRQM